MVQFQTQSQPLPTRPQTIAVKKEKVQKQFWRMYPWWSLCTLYLHACQVRVTVCVSGPSCLFGLHILRANYLPCVLSFYKGSFEG